MTGIVIVGAGECGVRTAFGLRENNYHGSITLIGEEVYTPYERPPLSKGVPPSRKQIAPLEDYVSANIDFLRDRRVISIDRALKRVHMEDGNTISYDNLVLATGARARTDPTHRDCPTLRTFDDAQLILNQLHTGLHVVIIGAGLIGLELASTARAVGADVTVLEVAGRAMARALPGDIAQVAIDRHLVEGVSVRFGITIKSIQDKCVKLEDGSHIAADILISSIGSIPVTEIAEQCGLVTENGIVVDKQFRTNDENIYAAGDCARVPYRGTSIRLESWRSARDQADYIASVLTGSEKPYTKVPWFWSDQFDLGIQATGLLDETRGFARRNLPLGGFILFQTDENDRLTFASGIGTGAEVGKDIRLSEILIERNLKVDLALLQHSENNLKAMLR